LNVIKIIIIIVSFEEHMAFSTQRSDNTGLVGLHRYRYWYRDTNPALVKAQCYLSKALNQDMESKSKQWPHIVAVRQTSETKEINQNSAGDKLFEK